MDARGNLDPLGYLALGVLALFIISVIIGVINVLTFKAPPEPEVRSTLTHIFDESYSRLVLVFPAEDLNPDLATALIGAFSNAICLPILEITANSTKVELSLLCPDNMVNTVRQTVLGVTNLPDIEISKVVSTSFGRALYTSIITTDKDPNLYPLSTIHRFTEVDPISSVLESVMPLAHNEQCSIHILLRYISDDNLEYINRQIKPLSEQLGYRTSPSQKRRLVEQRFYGLPTFAALVILSMVRPLDKPPGTRAVRFSSIASQIFQSEYSGLENSGWQKCDLPFPAIREDQNFFTANAAELAVLWHPFSNKVSMPGVRFLKRSSTTLDVNVATATGIALGTHRQRGDDITVHLPIEDLRLGHAVILGKTRVGKTTLAHNMARAIKELVPDSSLIILDPNGDWANDYALRSVPSHRVPHTYYLQFGNSDYPPALSLLTPPKGISIDSFIQSTSQTLKLVIQDQWTSPNMEDVLFNTVAALAQVPNATLLDVRRLYLDSSFRTRRVIPRISDEMVRNWWMDFDQSSISEQKRGTTAILTRINELTRSKPFRNITCRKEPGFDIGQVIEEGSDILISTVGPDIRAESNLLIEFLISRIHLTMFSRLGTLAARRPVFLLIDESQYIKGPSLPVLLSEAAKTGLCVVALTQYMDQWSDRLKDSILGNVGTLITFQVGPNDSRKLAHTLQPFTPAQAENLDKFEALVKMRVDGRTIPTYDIRTLPLSAPEDHPTYERIVEQTRARFTKPAHTLEPPPPLVPAAFEAAFSEVIEEVEED